MHYINAGNEGLLHFNFLLNTVIEDVNFATFEELNLIYALLLHKGVTDPIVQFQHAHSYQRL